MIVVRLPAVIAAGGGALVTLMQTLFSFEGRIRRTNYWLARLGFGFAYGFVVFVVVLVFLVLGGAAAAAGGGGQAAAGAVAAMLMLLYLLAFVPAVWVGLALEVKRCHDRDKSGWFILVYVLVSLTVIGALWPFIELGFVDGTPGPNRYGPSPKGIPGPAAGPASSVYV
jgi:uncharacterized membrane protein YhaH (DUF805 family)